MVAALILMLVLTVLGLIVVVLILRSENEMLADENSRLRKDNESKTNEIKAHYILRDTVEGLLATYHPDPDPKD